MNVAAPHHSTNPFQSTQTERPSALSSTALRKVPLLELQQVQVWMDLQAPHSTCCCLGGLWCTSLVMGLHSKECHRRGLMLLCGGECGLGEAEAQLVWLFWLLCFCVDGDEILGSLYCKVMIRLLRHALLLPNVLCILVRKIFRKEKPLKNLRKTMFCNMEMFWMCFFGQTFIIWQIMGQALIFSFASVDIQIHLNFETKHKNGRKAIFMHFSLLKRKFKASLRNVKCGQNNNNNNNNNSKGMVAVLARIMDTKNCFAFFFSLQTQDVYTGDRFCASETHKIIFF